MIEISAVCVSGKHIIPACIFPLNSIRAGYDRTGLFRDMEFQGISVFCQSVLLPAAGNRSVRALVGNFRKCQLFADDRCQTEGFISRFHHRESADAGVEPVADSTVGVVVKGYHILWSVIGLVNGTVRQQRIPAFPGRGSAALDRIEP